MIWDWRFCYKSLMVIGTNFTVVMVTTQINQSDSRLLNDMVLISIDVENVNKKLLGMLTK